MTTFHDAGAEKKEKKEKLKTKHKSLDDGEQRMVKRKLNISSKAPFKKCAAKVNKRLKELEAKGEAWHRDLKHAACAECSCQQVAGKGTDHYGSGLCYVHERSKRYAGTAKRINEADIIAQQQRHPRHFDNAEAYLAQIEIDGKEAESQFNLTPQMEKAKNLIEDMCSRLSDFDKDRDETTKNIIAKMNEVMEVVNSKTSLDVNDKKELLAVLMAIEDKVTNPLTAKGSKGPVEMSYETRCKLQMDGIDSLSKIAERVQKLQAITMITSDSFNEWSYKYYQELRKEFGTTTYVRKDGVTEIITGIGNAMMNAGNPRKGI